MHSVLNLQSHWTVTKQNQALNQRTTESSNPGFLAQNYRSKLTMVSNENKLSDSSENWNHNFWLRCLGAFVHQDTPGKNVVAWRL